MLELRANTEIKVPIGCFVDVGDGFTPQIDIDISASNEAELMKNDAGTVTSINGNTWAAISSCRGWYNLTLSASNVDTEGMLTVIVQDDSECLPVFVRFMVLSEAAWDSKYTADDDGLMDVNVKTFESDLDLTVAMKNSVNAEASSANQALASLLGLGRKLKNAIRKVKSKL